VSAEPLEDAYVVRAAGEIDMSTVDALARELELARARTPTVLLDLAGVTFIDSTGLHLLLDASQSSVRGDWAFYVVRPSAPVRRLLHISGAADLVRVVDPRAEAAVAAG
jgi:anti-anti-sigma factor